MTTRVNSQRDHILDAALRLMSGHGATGMSMRQLAAECGLQVAAIYHYFESKDALLEAVIAERRYGARVTERAPVDATLPADERLRLLFRDLWEGALSEEPIWRLLLGEGLRGEPAVLQVGQELTDLIRPAVAEWVRTEVPEVTDPDHAATVLLGLMFLGFIRHVFDPSLDPADVGADCAAAIGSAIPLAPAVL
jgi:AcrR family transcriptional regulator